MNEKQPTKKIGKARMAILSSFAAVVLFLFAFGCYGCSYQPIEAPSEEEAVNVIERLADTVWELDTAEGKPTLPELWDQSLETLAFGTNDTQNQQLEMHLTIEGFPPLYGNLVYAQEEGFDFEVDSQTLPITVVYSQSRDGSNETLTLVGDQSNTHLYYLKK
ncbi:MAG: hypothetical protein AB7C91_12445 [Sphaerochaeta sp.]|uniref:hypothetical protein n=1 Tax=Sphaerochaeta sp. TaxID=1972642 RepID=UPI002FCA1AD6